MWNQGTTDVLYPERAINLTPEAQFQTLASPCEIFGRQSGTGIGFYSEYFGFSPVDIILSHINKIQEDSQIIPTRCNNCVYSSQWLYSTCFG